MSAERFGRWNDIEASASMKSFRPKGSSDEGPGNDQAAAGARRRRSTSAAKRSNATHASTTDKDARLFRKGAGRESRLAYLATS